MRLPYRLLMWAGVALLWIAFAFATSGCTVQVDKSVDIYNLAPFTATGVSGEWASETDAQGDIRPHFTIPLIP